MDIPKISVIMPVYNASLFLREAIESILNQTFKDFEFIIINDGSTDGSANIIKEYTEKDKRIIFINESTNLGYVKRLNQALAITKGTYIARMDADDISLPTRLEKQVKYLDDHDSLDILGTSADTINDKGEVKKGWKLQASPKETAVHFIFTNYILHPTVMMRANKIPKEGYAEEFMPSEDFELWTRIQNGNNLYSLPEPLLIYRSHGASTSENNKTKGYEMASLVLKRQLNKLGMSPTDTEVEFHHQVSDFKTDKYSITEIDAWFKKIWKANNKINLYSKPSLLSTIIGRRFVINKKGLLMFCSEPILELGIFELLEFVYLSLKRLVRYMLQ